MMETRRTRILIAMWGSAVRACSRISRLGAAAPPPQQHGSPPAPDRSALIYALAGLRVGALCNLGGVVLFLNGVGGSSSWTTNVLGFKSELNDAAPGAILFVVGVLIIFITRYKRRG